MKQPLYLGIDPGITGGIAMLDDVSRTAKAWTMPGSRAKQWELLLAICSDRDVRCCIEHVHSRPGQSAPAQWTFAEHYGGLLMFLDVHLAERYEVVSPRRWQGALRCLSEGDKRITKRRAEILFPSLSVTHRTADALLLATYCRSIHTVRIPRTSHVARAGDVHGKDEEGRAQEEGIRQGRQHRRRA